MSFGQRDQRAPKTGPQPRRSIALHTAGGVVALVFLVLCALVIGSYAVVSRTVNEQLNETVRQTWQRASTGIAAPELLSPTMPPPGDGPLETPGLPAGTIAGLFLSGGADPTVGTVGFDEDQVLTSEDIGEMLSLAEHKANGQIVRVQLTSGSYAFMAQAVPQPPGVTDDVQVLVLGLPTKAYDATNHNLLWVLIAGSTIALVLVGLGVWWWVRRSLDPLEEVADTAVSVSSAPLASGPVDLAPFGLPSELTERYDEVGDVARALNELLTSVEDALESRAKSEDQLRKFVADASHELRTPLASVQGYADMIRLTETLSPDGTLMLNRVLSQSNRMSELVETLLTLARLDAAENMSPEDLAARREGERTKVDLGEILLEAASDAAMTHPDHDWQTTIPEQPVIVQASRPQITQLVQNLLSNAQKHTPAGTRVQAELFTRGSNAILTVSDNGPGISPDLQSRLFDRFVRGDDARSSSEGSTGLGLSIVRSVARAHGGEARVESGQGLTVFTVTLPLARPQLG